MEKSDAKEGNTTFNFPSLVGGEARVTPLKWKERVRASGKGIGGDTPGSLLPISKQAGPNVCGVAGDSSGTGWTDDCGPHKQIFSKEHISISEGVLEGVQKVKAMFISGLKTLIF